jgi:two-component system, OmpR family, KDP operon response regulator KdpE
MSAGRMLVIDCDSKSVHLLRQILSLAGYEVISANKIDRALQMITEEQPSLIITESTLQCEADGIDLIHRVREFSEIPMILLSADAETGTVLRAFEAGADDFIAKPFDAKILLARVKAVLKRSKSAPLGSQTLTFKNLSINLASHQVAINDQPVALTQTEYNLLTEMAKHADQVMVHEQLLVAVWGPQYSHEIDYLRSYVHTLRRKIEVKPSQPVRIISLSGVGYMFVSNPSETPGK